MYVVLCVIMCKAVMEEDSFFKVHDLMLHFVLLQHLRYFLSSVTLL